MASDRKRHFTIRMTPPFKRTWLRLDGSISLNSGPKLPITETERVEPAVAEGTTTLPIWTLRPLG